MYYAIMRRVTDECTGNSEGRFLPQEFKRHIDAVRVIRKLWKPQDFRVYDYFTSYTVFLCYNDGTVVREVGLIYPRGPKKYDPLDDFPF